MNHTESGRDGWEQGFMLGQHAQGVGVLRALGDADHFYRVAFDPGYTSDDPPRPDIAPYLNLVRELAREWSAASSYLNNADAAQRLVWVEGYVHGCTLPALELERAQYERARLAHAAFGPPPPTAAGPTYAELVQVRESIVTEAVAAHPVALSVARPMVADARAAALILRRGASNRDLLLAAHIEATADQWQRWPTPEPSKADSSLLALVRLILHDQDAPE